MSYFDAPDSFKASWVKTASHLAQARAGLKIRHYPLGRNSVGRLACPEKLPFRLQFRWNSGSARHFLAKYDFETYLLCRLGCPWLGIGCTLQLIDARPRLETIQFPIVAPRLNH